MPWQTVTTKLRILKQIKNSQYIHMDSEIIKALTGSGSTGLTVGLVLLQIGQMVGDYFRDSRKSEMVALTAEVKELKELLIASNTKIETLENKVFVLETDKARLTGLLASQDIKDDFLKDIISPKH